LIHVGIIHAVIRLPRLRMSL